MRNDQPVNQIERTILQLLEERGSEKTICPSEAARRMAELAGHPERWRAWLNRVRATAVMMAEQGTIVILQRGERVNPETARGATRLGLPWSLTQEIEVRFLVSEKSSLCERRHIVRRW
jgi:hypothetical protein